MMPSARSIALKALIRWSKTGELVSDIVRNETSSLSTEDQKFAFELSSGTVRRFWTIEWYAKGLVSVGLPKNTPQRLLLFLSLYQRLFHENIPPHALIYEHVELAKKVCNSHFASFLNAILRKSLLFPLTLPQGTSPDDLSVRYSFPVPFIRRLLSLYGSEQTIQILEAENVKTKSLSRGHWDTKTQRFSWEESSSIVQNPTQPSIFETLARRIDRPKRILDLCAGAGGKALMAWEIFRPETLIANDPSQQRLQRCAEEAKRLGAELTISCADGLHFPEENLFDLVLVDPPCTNSGVLFKCPEARHRLTDESVRRHVRLQQDLLKKSSRLLAPQGALIYTTCSILSDENEKMASFAVSSLNLSLAGPTVLILPDKERYEGGFGALFTRKESAANAGQSKT